MAFNSLEFAAFFLLVWVVRAFALEPRFVRRLFPRVARRHVVDARNAFLLLVSYLFYAAWDWRFLGLLWLSTANDFWVGRALENETEPRRRRLYISLSLAGNLGLLGFFKYYDFFASSLGALLHRVGLDVEPRVLHILLPVGISFYTFQSLSYTIDVYRGTLRPERRLLNFAVFVAFFPQLVAGPIERPARLLPQFRRLREVTWVKVSTGCYLIAVGLFKKVVIADTVAKVANAAFDLGRPTGLEVVIGAYAFAFQIYADFSAYSDIARGTARCLGFELSRNFDMPYLSATPSEFWRRWHISLSTWLRDYVYVSLGGNRYGRARTYRNLMLTMVIGGLWHGAAWTFVAWGAFHGAILCAYRPVESVARSWSERQPPWLRRALHVLAVVVFFQLVSISWIFFRAESMSQVQSMLYALVDSPRRPAAGALSRLGPVPLAAVLAGGLVGVQVIQRLKRDSWLAFHAPLPVRGLVYALGALGFVWMGQDGGESFIYFQF